MSTTGLVIIVLVAFVLGAIVSGVIVYNMNKDSDSKLIKKAKDHDRIIGIIKFWADQFIFLYSNNDKLKGHEKMELCVKNVTNILNDDFKISLSDECIKALCQTVFYDMTSGAPINNQQQIITENKEEQ